MRGSSKRPPRASRCVGPRTRSGTRGCRRLRKAKLHGVKISPASARYGWSRAGTAAHHALQRARSHRARLDAIPPDPPFPEPQLAPEGRHARDLHANIRNASGSNSAHNRARVASDPLWSAGIVRSDPISVGGSLRTGPRNISPTPKADSEAAPGALGHPSRASRNPRLIAVRGDSANREDKNGRFNSVAHE